MYGHREHSMRAAYPNAAIYCPCFQTCSSCPYRQYRAKTEEYPAQYIKAPDTPPPSTIPSGPSAAAGAGSISPRTLLPCVYKFTYLWLKNGESYWTYITYIGPSSLSGWRYSNEQWMQFGLNLNQIRSFSCS